MRHLVLIVASLLAGSPALPPGLAQSGRPAAPGQELGKSDTVRIDTDLVTLTATVTDARGRYVAGLRREDFAVYEDGVRQQLDYFSTGDKVPVSLGIIFDTSGSMADKIEDVRDAVEHFVKAVAPGDEIFLARFGDEAELVQDFTDDRRRILRAVERLNPRGSTALYDAVVVGLGRVSRGRHRKRALLLLTDGNDTSSEAGLDEALALARKTEVVVYALGIGHGERGSFGHGSPGGVLGRQGKDQVDMSVLRAFAEATGGEAFHLENAHAGGRDLVDEAAGQVAAELKQQYTLGYYPSNARRDGAYRRIRVEVADVSRRVRARRGYYAPRDTSRN
jgi:Ca-activated chloride channel homolog